MRKIFIFTLSLLIALGALATGISAERTLPLVVDNADILTDYEESALLSALEGITESQCIEIAVVTVNSTNGKSAMDYADDFYDYNGYGYGENDDGALLLIDMGAREWHITTHGNGAYYLDDYVLYMIEEAFIDDLASGNYFEAFLAFANACDAYIYYAKEPAVSDEYSDGYNNEYPVVTDEYFDGYYEEDHGIGAAIFASLTTFLVPSLIVGFIISLIIVSVMKSGMKTVRSASGASDYMVNGSLSLRSQSDRYLYSNTVRTRRDTSSHSGGHGGSRSSFGGGSSMHRSSSGRSHGGRGGRF